MFRSTTRRGRITAGALVAALLAPLAALAAEAPAAGAPASTGRLKARIFGSNGKTPVAGAVLRAYHLDSGKVYSSSPSSSKGECELSGLPFGYVDIAIETKDATFVGNQVVNVPPSGNIAVSFTLTKYAERSPAWWGGRTPRQIPGTRTESQGIAEVELKHRGREFWTGPKGIAIIGGATVAVLLAIASSGSTSSTVSPSLP